MWAFSESLMIWWMGAIRSKLVSVLSEQSILLPEVNFHLGAALDVLVKSISSARRRTAFLHQVEK